MKICYIAAVNPMNESTRQLLGLITQISVNVFAISCNIAWSVIAIKVIVEIIRFINTKNKDRFIKEIKNCSMASAWLIAIPHFTKFIDSFF